MLFSKILNKSNNSILKWAYLQITPLSHLCNHFLCLFSVTLLFSLADDVLNVLLNLYYTFVVAKQFDFALCLLHSDFNSMNPSSITDSLNLVCE